MTIHKSIVAGIVSGSLLATAAVAFPDGPIDFVIPYGPGGGNDTIVRMIAPAMERHLPGNVSVVPQNIPGAGGQLGATTVYRADPDGYTIGLFPMPGLALPELLGDDVAFSLRDITWLARIGADHYVLLVSADSDIHTLDDFMDGREITFLATGFGSTMLAASQMVSGVLDVETTFVTGYPSSSEALVGLIRGDGDAAMGVIEPSASYVEAGDLRAIAVSTETDIFPDVPTFADLGHPELNILSIDRWIGAPPNLDPAAREVLEAALEAVAHDPEFLEQAERAGIDPAFLDGAAVTQLVEESFEFYERYRELLANPAD